MAKTALIIIGTHRSGTSTVAGCLHSAGIPLGYPLLPPGSDNPKGYFEHQSLVQFHDHSLVTNGSHWADASHICFDRQHPDFSRLVDGAKKVFCSIADQHNRIVLKDPRLPRFLEVWDRALEELGVEATWLLPVRAPRGVIDSLHRRDLLSIEHASALWYRDLAAAARFLPDRRHCLISYERLLTDPLLALAPLLEEGWIDAIQAQKAAVFIDPQLNHNQSKTQSFGEKATQKLHLHLNKGIRRGKLQPFPSDLPVALSTSISNSGESSWPLVRVQVYYSRASEHPSEERSVMQSIPTATPRKVEWLLPPGAWSQLRLDPINHQGAVLVSDLAVHLDNGAVFSPGFQDLRLRSPGSLRWTASGPLILSHIDDCCIDVILPNGRTAVKCEACLIAIPSGGNLRFQADERGLSLPTDPATLCQLLAPVRTFFAENLVARQAVNIAYLEDILRVEREASRISKKLTNAAVKTEKLLNKRIKDLENQLTEFEQFRTTKKQKTTKVLHKPTKKEQNPKVFKQKKAVKQRKISQ